MGRTLRSTVQSTGIQEAMGITDDKTFATFWVSLFMVVSGVLMLPEFFGGAWNPFVAATTPVLYAKSMVLSSSSSSSSKKTTSSQKKSGEDTESETDEEPSVTIHRSNRRRKNTKKKVN